MANLTRTERKEAIDALLSPDLDGSPIYSVDHRAETNIGDDFMMSFVPFEATVDDQGRVDDARMENRLISLVVANNMPIQSNYFSKPFASTVMDFVNGMVLSPGTLVTVFFKQQTL